MPESSFSQDLDRHSNSPNRCGLFPVWSEGRVIRRGRPLSVFLRELLLYSTFFAPAMLYSMAAVKIL